jgi:hypothetical protein
MLRHAKMVQRQYPDTCAPDIPEPLSLFEQRVQQKNSQLAHGADLRQTKLIFTCVRK